jgi:carboxymethylenebutenolidase
VDDGVTHSDTRLRLLGRRELLMSSLAAALLLRISPVRAAPAEPPRPGGPPDKPTPSGITVPPGDPGITTGTVEYPGVIGPLRGYLATPTGTEVYPGVLVVHDAQGLTEHFKDIARRLAKAGFVALAPDLASRAGGTDALADPAKVTSALAGMGPGQFLQDLNASVRHLEAHPLVAKTRIGAIGFGLGGNIIWLVLFANHDVKAAVCVSGSVPADRMAASLNAAVLTIYGENDQRDTEGVTEFENAMKKAGLAFTVKVEPKAGRDFFNDTTSRYVPAAAKDAWGLTLDWFAQHLKG